MCSWDIISDLMEYTEKEYPDIDIREGKRKFRQCVYEKIIVDDIVNHCCERMFNDPIEIVENYELTFLYLSRVYHKKNNIYRVQLRVIRKILLFLRRRFARYG
jgi:hypothetical protein